MNAILDTGSDGEGRDRGGGARLQGSLGICVALAMGLAACQAAEAPRDDGAQAAAGYPSLSSVPDVSRPSTPIEERRRIVRDLIDERDRSRHQTAVVRTRSGLSVSPPPASTGDDLQVEDIIPHTPGGGDAFRLAPDDKVSADSVYRGESRFEDGGLDDFIRQLKQDTNPTPPPDALPPSDEPTSEQPDEDDISANFPGEPDIFGRLAGEDQRVWLAAFAPAVKERPSAEPAFTIRLAATEEEPGFFCRYLGWSVAWSSMCVDEAAEQSTSEDGEQGVGADLKQELDHSSDEETPERSTDSTTSSSDAEEQSGGRRLSEQNAAEAIENVGETALAPVASSLEKLRDFIEARRSRGTASSTSARTPSGSEESRTLQAKAVDRPPIPESRPRQRKDITVVDRGERFDFIRTPLPAFKPAPDLPVILPPEGQRGTQPETPSPALKPSPDLPVVLPPEGQRSPKPAMSAPPNPPQPRPNDLLTEGNGEGASPLDQIASQALKDVDVALALPADSAGNGASTLEAPSPSSRESSLSSPKPPPQTAEKTPASPPETPPQLSLATPAPEPAAAPTDNPTTLGPILIPFEPEKPGLPEGAAPRLAALLQAAEEQYQKIHIIGEAGTNHLARRRATDIGAELVRLGATVEILEYDHQVVVGVDQVRLVLMSDNADRLFNGAKPAPVEQ